MIDLTYHNYENVPSYETTLTNFEVQCVQMCEKAEVLLRQEVAAQRELISDSRQDQEKIKCIMIVAHVLARCVDCSLCCYCSSE